jgi:hypothetical protein
MVIASKLANAISHSAARHCWALSACLILAAAVICGCSALVPSQSPQKAEVKALRVEDQSAGSTTVSALQSEVMRFADDYVEMVAQGVNDVSANNTNEAGRVILLKWKLAQATAAYIDAAGQNPVLNAIDMVVLASLSRMVVEANGFRPEFDGPVTELLQVQRRLETNAWRMVDTVLKDEQKVELKELIQKWREHNPTQRYISGVRFREFAQSLGNAPQAQAVKPTSVFNLLFIDPMAGLDPTVRAIEQTRQSAERMMYYAQRAPMLLSWQAEVLTYQWADQPAPRQVLADLDRVSRAAEVYGHTAEQLPKLIDEQREAAIKQLLAGVAAERTNLLADLSSEEAKLRGVLTETRATLEAGGQMATSVDSAIQSLHTFVKYVSPPPASNQPPTNVSTNRRPFDVLDYGKAATQVGGMASDLNTLLNSVNQSTPQVARLGQQAHTDARRVIDHAFAMGAVLILILLTGLVVAGLSYRVLVAKLTSNLQGQNSEPKNRSTA